jgi:glycerol-3-phosphate dehydrogenase
MNARRSGALLRSADALGEPGGARRDTLPACGASLLDRATALRALREQRFDVLVIGGGIAGAGLALEAARAGAQVALVEARDFASGTSSKSSKLVHGGLRYIAQGHFGLTRESVRERNALLREADGLVQPMPFLLPVREGDRHGRRSVGIGLALYDFFAGMRTRRWFTPDALLERAPGLSTRALQGGWAYLDAQTDDARLVMRVLAEARALGAAIVNDAKVEGLLRRDGAVCGAIVHDRVGDAVIELRAGCVINATGVWADALRHEVGAPRKLRPLRGSHLLFPGWRLPLAQAVAFFHPDDGRPVFALPWEGATMVGTTDLDHREDLAHEPGITRTELRYLLRAVQSQFPSLGLRSADVLSTWSGVRPVVASGEAVDPSKEGREHLVVEEQGLLTVTGGKLTTFRSTAVQALKLAAHRVPALQRVQPHARVLAPAPASVQNALAVLPPALQQRWLARYGAQAADVLRAAQAGETPTIGATETTWAELRWACRHEAVNQLDDLLLRRTRLGLLLPAGGLGLWPRLQPMLSEELGWDAQRCETERVRYRELIASCYSVPAEVEG